MKKFTVISIHYTTECNLNCPFCYKVRTNKSEEKSRDFWIKLIPYIKQLTNQVALGGGEPFVDKKFIIKFGKECKRYKLIFNVTSNGRLLMNLSDKELKEVLRNVKMISLSFDDNKIKSKEDLINYKKLVGRIKTITKCQVGSNLLINEEMFKKNILNFVTIVNYLFKNGVDRVFALYPKNMKKIDILKHKNQYAFLTDKYEHFYVDDLTKMIFEQNTYLNWKIPCHYGKDLISINEKGYITGCSFDKDKDAILKLEQPKDLLKIKKLIFEERFSCPFLDDY
jgi:MoaA/NifB/PqqE/SkfB family radical SAM enzyme